MQKFCYTTNHTFECTFISLANIIKHDIKSIFKVGNLTLESFSLNRLHIVESSTLIGHTLEYRFNILECNLTFGNHIHNLGCSVSFSLNFFEVFLQLAIHINTSFSELTNLRTSEICSSLDLSVCKDKSSHIDTKTCRNIGKTFCCVVKFIRLYAVCRKLSCIVNQVLDTER